MKRKSYTTEQIIAILGQADTGKKVKEVCRSSNVSEQSFYHWFKQNHPTELGSLYLVTG